MGSSPVCLVVDANTLIAICSKESIRDAIATVELARYSLQGYAWYAPAAIIVETLYVLCNKRIGGALTTADYAAAMQMFQKTMNNILSPPNGDKSLILRVEQIGTGYGCSRSADGIYIALAEELSNSSPTVLLTFDRGLPNQAAKNAPTVKVHLL